MTIGTPASLFSPSQSVSTGTTYASPSFTPTSGAVCFISGYIREDVASAAAPTVSLSQTHSGSWSWSSHTRQNSQTQRRRSFVFWSLVPSSPGSGTVTITASAAVDQWTLCGWEVSSASSTITNVDSNPSTSTSPTQNLLSAPASTSLVFGTLYMSGDSDGATPGAGFTELFDVIPGVVPNSYQVQYRTGTTSSAVSWSDASTSNITVVLEVTESVSSSAVVPPLLRRNRLALRPVRLED